MLEEELEIKPATEGDPTKCYICGEAMTTNCARCKQPVCAEHQQQVRDSVSQVSMQLCDECADYYESVVPPD